jgi:hypothetical protein
MIENVVGVVGVGGSCKYYYIIAFRFRNQKANGNDAPFLFGICLSPP